jgi:hypothetical protein
MDRLLCESCDQAKRDRLLDRDRLMSSRRDMFTFYASSAAIGTYPLLLRCNID